MGMEISVMKARQNLGQLLEEVFYHGDRIIIKKAKKPMAVLVPLQDYVHLEQRRESVLAAYEDIWKPNRNIPPSETETDVEKAICEVRAMC